jgi:hypothetical protein
MKTLEFFSNLFRADYDRHQGVRPIQIYVIRMVFGLAFVFVGIESWSTIIGHEGEWRNLDAIAFSVWAAYSALCALGVINPLKMLPIMVFIIFYKTIWLFIVAFPLWVAGTWIGSPAEEMTKVFLWVILPMVAMPWKYFFISFMQKNKVASVLG